MPPQSQDSQPLHSPLPLSRRSSLTLVFPLTHALMENLVSLIPPHIQAALPPLSPTTLLPPSRTPTPFCTVLICLSYRPNPKRRDSGCFTSGRGGECLNQRGVGTPEVREGDGGVGGQDSEVAGVRTELLPRCTLPRPRPFASSSQPRAPQPLAFSRARTRWKAAGPGRTHRASPSLSQDCSEGASQRQRAGPCWLHKRCQQLANGRTVRDPRSAMTSPQALALMGIVVFFPPLAMLMYLSYGH